MEVHKIWQSGAAKQQAARARCCSKKFMYLNLREAEKKHLLNIRVDIEKTE